jgi:nucleotide-binding universal stress UspA family protein
VSIFGRFGTQGSTEKHRGEAERRFRRHHHHMPAEQDRADTGGKNILVALQGDELDDELITLAYYMVRQRKGQVFAVYGIEVPRTLPVDAELPEQAAKATSVLEHAVSTAERLNFTLEPEIVQSRSWGASLVDEAEAHQCALIIMGISYRMGRGGRFELGDAVPYVLAHARSRVWVIRAAQRNDSQSSNQRP